MMQRNNIRDWVALVAAAGLMAPAAVAGDAEPEAAAVFARVNGGVISVEQYDAELGHAFRSKFYHRRPPDGQLAQLQREVGDALIERVLLLAEARRRGIEPDAEEARAGVEEFEARNRDNPRWRQDRDELLPLLRKRLEERSVLARLERAVRVAPAATPEQARAYFEAHPDTFTEPERLRLSVILLKLDPGVPQAELDQAFEEAKALRQRLAEGADFAALARERSGDASAPQGGDMGYVHRGMLPGPLHALIDQLAPGALSEPVRLLEGVGIFRLDERLRAQRQSFEDARERAAGLWRREREEAQWSEFKSGLRRAATIEVVDRARYPAVVAVDE